MGCWYTKHDINDRHPNIFKVMNVDEQGQLVSPGQLELTETEMVWYQKGKTSTKWPLAYIRRYGFESELFSFECGRRCPTGHGIYAFRCRRAELLFNLLQERIAVQRTTQEENTTTIHGANEFPIPLVTTGPAVPLRPLPPPTNSETSYLEPLSRPTAATRTQSGFARLNSISSNGPSSPSAITPPIITSPEPAPEHNNNKRTSLSLEHSYSNTLLPMVTEPELNLVSGVTVTTTSQQYMNIEPPISPSPSVTSETYSQYNSDNAGNCHLYMNVIPGDMSPVLTVAPQPLLPIIAKPADSVPQITTANELIPVVTIPLLEEEKENQIHCYANLESDEIEGLRNQLKSSETTSSISSALTATGTNPRDVVYAILDLDKTKEETQTNNLTVPPPESPKKIAKGYTIIDFNKTEAVSQIAKPKQDSEGSRKTRHNSTISELGQSSSARHSSSLSD